MSADLKEKYFKTHRDIKEIYDSILHLEIEKEFISQWIENAREFDESPEHSEPSDKLILEDLAGRIYRLKIPFSNSSRELLADIFLSIDPINANELSIAFYKKYHSELCTFIQEGFTSFFGTNKSRLCYLILQRMLDQPTRDAKLLRKFSSKSSYCEKYLMEILMTRY